MKINEVIVEELNTGTGTPNPTAPAEKLSKRSQQRNAPVTTATPATPPAEPEAPVTPATTPGANAFGQMAQQVTTQPSSTDGTVAQTPTGQVHTASPNNPNAQPAQTTDPVQPATPATNSGLDDITDEELAGYAKKWDDAKLARASANPAVDPRVKKVVDDEIANRSVTTAATKPAQATKPAPTPTPQPAQTNQPAQPAQPKQSLWQKIKAGAQGAMSGTQPAKTGLPDSQVQSTIANDALPIWRKFLQQYLAGYGNTPENIPAAAKAFATKNYPQAGKAEIESGIKTVSDAKTADAYILKTANRALANYKVGITPDKEPTQTVQGSQDTQAPSTPKPKWITTPDGIEVKPASGNKPTYARYGKDIFRLTDDDRWVDKRDKPVSATLTGLLNNAIEQT